MRVTAADVAALVAGAAVPVVGTAGIVTAAFQSAPLFCGLFGAPDPDCVEKQKRVELIATASMLALFAGAFGAGYVLRDRPIGKGLLAGASGTVAVVALVSAVDAARAMKEGT